MSIGLLMWAKTCDEFGDLTASERLALMAIADLCQDSTYAIDVSVAPLAEWARQPTDEVAHALTTLERKGLWYVLPDTDRVLLNLPGWERAYEDWVRHRFGGSKRRLIDPHLRRAVFDRDGWVCLHCGTSAFLSIDHKYPVSRGGTDIFENLQTLCRSCNASKGDKVPA